MLRHIRLADSLGTSHSGVVGPSPASWLPAAWRAEVLSVRVTHRRLDEHLLCRCRYPLYTLCSPHVSPFEAPDAQRARRWARRHHVRQHGCNTSPYVSSFSSSAAVTGGPQAAARYRCDICDGFEDLERTTYTESPEVSPAAIRTGASTPSAASVCVSSIPPTAAAAADDGDGSVEADGEGRRDAPDTAPASSAAAAQQQQQQQQEGEEEDEDEEEEEEEIAAQPISTDITNTFMDDVDVAELRYLDPFQVEVLGPPATRRLSRLMADSLRRHMTRCRLRPSDLAAAGDRLLVASAANDAHYERWAAAAAAGASAHAAKRSGGGGGGGGGAARRLEGQARLLGEACDCCRFAIASYGLPYELGFFASAADVARLQAMPQRRYTCATGEEQMESMRRMLQGEATDGADPLLEFAHARYTLQYAQASLALVLDHRQGRVLLVFRGTTTLADAAVDVAEGYGLLSLTRPARPGVASAAAAATRRGTTSTSSSSSSGGGGGGGTGGSGRHGRGAAVKDGKGSAGAPGAAVARVPWGMWAATLEAGAHCLPLLRRVHAMYPQYDLIITGHSLGGMLASLFYMAFAFPHQQRAVVAPARPAAAHASAASSPPPSPPASLLEMFPRVRVFAFGAAPTLELKAIPFVNAHMFPNYRRHATGAAAANDQSFYNGESGIYTFSVGKDVVSRLQVRSIYELVRGNDAGEEEEGAAAALTEDELPTLGIPGRVFNITYGPGRAAATAAATSPAAAAAAQSTGSAGVNGSVGNRTSDAPASAGGLPPPPPRRRVTGLREITVPPDFTTYGDGLASRPSPASQGAHAHAPAAATAATSSEEDDPKKAAAAAEAELAGRMAARAAAVVAQHRADSDRPPRDGLIVSVESVKHHFPIYYLRALNRLRESTIRRLRHDRNAAPPPSSSSSPSASASADRRPTHTTGAASGTTA